MREVVEQAREDRPALHLQHRLRHARVETAEAGAGAGREHDRRERRRRARREIALLGGFQLLVALQTEDFVQRSDVRFRVHQ